MCVPSIAAITVGNPAILKKICFYYWFLSVRRREFNCSVFQVTQFVSYFCHDPWNRCNGHVEACWSWGRHPVTQTRNAAHALVRSKHWVERWAGIPWPTLCFHGGTSSEPNATQTLGIISPQRVPDTILNLCLAVSHKSN